MSAAEGKRPYLAPKRLNLRGAGFRRLAVTVAERAPEWTFRAAPKPIGWVVCALAREERTRLLCHHRNLVGQRPALREWADLFVTFGNFAACLAEAMRGAEASDSLSQHVVHGLSHLDELVETGGGAVVVTAHVGPWDRAGSLLAGRYPNLRLALGMQREGDRDARQLQDTLRERKGLKVIHLGEHPSEALDLLRHLRSGGWLALQLDRAGETSDHVTVGNLRVPLGPFKLAALARVPLVLVLVRRLGFHRYEFSAGAPIVPSDPRNDAELRQIARSVGQDVEAFLKANLVQWFQFEVQE